MGRSAPLELKTMDMLAWEIHSHHSATATLLSLSPHHPSSSPQPPWLKQYSPRYYAQDLELERPPAFGTDEHVSRVVVLTFWTLNYTISHVS